MEDIEWDTLFNLIQKAINLEGLTAEEKGEKIRSEATIRDQDDNLEEFVAQVDM